MSTSTSMPTESSSCELLIIGAGPAGMAAALAAAPSGVRITLLDDNPAPGGQIWRDGPAAHLPPQALQLREALARCTSVRVLCGTRVVSLANAKALLLEDAERGWVQRYDKLILCTGARQLLLPFPGWTLPGVTGAGGLQALIKAGLPVAGERIVIAGSGPLLLAAAATARKSGAQVLRVTEQASLASVAAFAMQLARWPGKALQALTLADKGYRTSCHIVSAQGRGRIESVRLQQGSKATEIACDRVACGFGLIPNTQLGQLLGCALGPALGGAQAIAVDTFQATSGHQRARRLCGGRMHRLWRQRTRTGPRQNRRTRRCRQHHRRATALARACPLGGLRHTVAPPLRAGSVAEKYCPAGHAGLPLRRRAARRARPVQRLDRRQAAHPLRHGRLPGPRLRRGGAVPLRLGAAHATTAAVAGTHRDAGRLVQH